jgi:hypothetical protein
MSHPALAMLRIRKKKKLTGDFVRGDEKNGGKARLERFVEQSFEN